MRKRGSRNDGQALVEMAIALPLLILVIIGIFEIALMANAYLTVQHAAREAVRVGITGASNATILVRAQSAASNLDSGRLQVEPAPPLPEARTTGTDLAVTVSYRYEPVTPLFGPLKEIKLKSRLTGRVE